MKANRNSVPHHIAMPIAIVIVVITGVSALTILGIIDIERQTENSYEDLIYDACKVTYKIAFINGAMLAKDLELEDIKKMAEFQAVHFLMSYIKGENDSFIMDKLPPYPEEER